MGSRGQHEDRLESYHQCSYPKPPVCLDPRECETSIGRYRGKETRDQTSKQPLLSLQRQGFNNPLNLPSR